MLIAYYHTSFTQSGCDYTRTHVHVQSVSCMKQYTESVAEKYTVAFALELYSHVHTCTLGNAFTDHLCKRQK